MMRKISAVVFWAVWFPAAFLIISSPAWAWGPGVHIECSQFLLKSLMLLTPFVRKLLISHPPEFIYGSLCPDMVLGKRFMRPERNNHRWRVGFRVLYSAKDSRQQAFALGYLSHLAADTVAHNHFVPDQLLEKYDRGRRGHLTHEILFDAMLDDEVWAVAGALSRRSFRDCDRLMRRKIPRTPLPKRVNQRIFRSGGVLVRIGGWEKIVSRIRTNYGHELDSQAIVPYLDAVHRAALDFLNDPDSAACRKECPTGGLVLPEAERLRRSMKRMNRNSMLDREFYSTMIDEFRAWREINSYRRAG